MAEARPAMTLTGLEKLSKGELAAFARPVLTGDWNGASLVALLFNFGNLRDERDCIDRMMSKFKSGTEPDKNCTEPEAYELWGKLRQVATSAAASHVQMAVPPVPQARPLAVPAQEGRAADLVFVNRESEVETTLSLMRENEKRWSPELRNSDAYNICVAAQNLGSGKSTFGMQFPVAAKDRAWSEPQLASLAKDFRTLRINLANPALAPRQNDDITEWLTWAFSSCAHAAFGPDTKPWTVIPHVPTGLPPLFIFVDEADAVCLKQLRVGKDFQGNDFQSPYYQLLDFLFKFEETPHLILCAGVSPELLRFGRGLSRPPWTPATLKVHHLQFSAFDVKHIDKLLGAHVPCLKSDEERLRCATLLLERTSGVARLVHYGIRYLQAHQDPELKTFVTFLIVNGKKDVVRCFEHKDMVGAFFALAEFALWKFPLRGDDPFQWEQLTLTPEEKTHLRESVPSDPIEMNTKTLDVVSYLGFHTSKTDTIMTDTNLFVALAPTALIDAIVQCYNIRSPPNPSFQNYQVIKKLLGPSHIPYSAKRELLPFKALVRAYSVPLPAPPFGSPVPTLSSLLPFLRGSVVGLAPLSIWGSPDPRVVKRRPMPKLASNVRRLDQLQPKEAEQRKVVG
jgi:hypothetical protein